MYIINTIPHGKWFVRYLRTRFCIRNLSRSLRSLVRFLIRQQLVRKYRTQALSMKNSLYFTRRFEFPACAKLVRSTITFFSLGLIFYFKKMIWVVTSTTPLKGVSLTVTVSIIVHRRQESDFTSRSKFTKCSVFSMERIWNLATTDFV